MSHFSRGIDVFESIGEVKLASDNHTSRTPAEDMECFTHFQRNTSPDTAGYPTCDLCMCRGSRMIHPPARYSTPHLTDMSILSRNKESCLDRGNMLCRPGQSSIENQEQECCFASNMWPRRVEEPAGRRLRGLLSRWTTPFGQLEVRHSLTCSTVGLSDEYRMMVQVQSYTGRKAGRRQR